MLIDAEIAVVPSLDDSLDAVTDYAAAAGPSVIQAPGYYEADQRTADRLFGPSARAAANWSQRACRWLPFPRVPAAAMHELDDAKGLHLQL